MNSRVKNIKHVILSSDRPAPTDPTKVFTNFQDCTRSKTSKKKLAASSGKQQLYYRSSAMTLLAEYASKKENEQRRHSRPQMPESRTDIVEDRTPMIGSKDAVYSQTDCGFFEAVLLAYANHWNLQTSPDDWWYCVINQMSHAVRFNSYKAGVRKLFVNFEGKKDLFVEVTRAEGWPVFEDFNYTSFFNKMGLEIAKNVKVPEYVDGVTADFSSTTPVQKIVSQITLMSSLQGFFIFGLRGGCGIPAIEMTGVEDDWMKLLSKLKSIKRVLWPITELLNLESSWWDLVENVFEKLLETFRGNPDEDWWSRIMTYGRPYGSGQFLASGPPCYTGWIVEFLRGRIGTSEVGSLIGDFPSGIVTVPLSILDVDTLDSDKGALVAGMVGFTVHESICNERVSLRPFQGWSLLLPKKSPFRGKKYTEKSTQGGQNKKMKTK